MPRNPRLVLPGCAYHITQRGTNHQHVFFSQTDRRVYLDHLAANLPDAGVRLLAFCLMTNHIHLIAVPAHEDSLAVLLRRTHGRYAQMVNTRRRRSGHLWQSRFYSCPLSESHLVRALAYVELNPVRAGITPSPELYPWSSATPHLGLAPFPNHLLDYNFYFDRGGAPAWQQLLASSRDEAQERLLRRSTYAGRPYGEEEFIQYFETRFNRKWRRLPAMNVA
jgi:putative transposase